MVDCTGKVVKIGDYVRYYHRRASGICAQDIGEIIGFEDQFARIKYMVSNGVQIDSCLRSKSGMTKLTDAEAMLQVLEKVASYD